MDFEFDEDQLNLQASVAEVLAKECPPTYLRAVVEGEAEPSELWSTLVALDWPGLAVPEPLGGVGLSTVELAIVAEQLGYVVDPTPLLATTTQFAPLVEACGDDEQQRRFLGGVAAGTTTGTLALAGEEGRWDPEHPAVAATPVDGGWALRGTAAFVVDGDRADEVAVVAATADGPQVFVVPAADVDAERTPALDETLHVTRLTFDGVVVDEDRRLAGGTGTRGIERGLATAVTGLSMAMVGACQRGLDLVLDYVRERQQFGVPVGSFQAVKHKAVDVHLAIERGRAVATFAALTLAEDDARWPLAAAMAKAAAGDAQRIAFQHCIQLFGGIGFTWENDLHLYLRRAKAGELLFGGAAEHRRRVGHAVLADPRAMGS